VNWDTLESDGFATAFSQSFLRVETEADPDGIKWTAMSLSRGVGVGLVMQDPRRTGSPLG